MDDSEAIIADLRKRIANLLDWMAPPAKCKDCGAEIRWITNRKTGKNMPINAEGVSHFADCPGADRFRKK